MKKLLIIIILALQYTTTPAQTIQKVSAEEAQAYLAKPNTDSLLIIDGRSDEMFQSGHLNKAINIDAYNEDLEVQLAKVLNRGHLFIYCTKTTRSDSIINTLSLLNYKGEIVQMMGGFSAWKEKEFEIVAPKTCETEEQTD